MGWLSRKAERRRQREAARRIIQAAEAKIGGIYATIGDAAAESARRSAFLEDMAANGTPEERQWTMAALLGPLVVTLEEAERIRNAPSPTERIASYRAACAAYDAAHANDTKAALDAAFPRRGNKPST